MSHSPAGSAFGSGSGSGAGSGSNPATPEQLDDLSFAVDEDHRAQSGVMDGEQEEEAAQQGDSDDDDDDDDEEDGSDSDAGAAASVSGLTMSEREILTLLAVDKKLASVLDLAAAALSSLNLTGETDNAATGPPGLDATLTDRSKIFEAHASEYFKTLDDIQLSLRNAIHVVRRLRISPRLLSENPPSSSVLRGGGGSTTATGMAAGALPHARDGTGEGERAEAEPDPLGRGAKRMETETWRDIVEALTSMLPVPVPEPEPASNTLEQTGELQAGVGKQGDDESNASMS